MNRSVLGAGLMVACVLALATSASAGCAWVLWQEEPLGSHRWSLAQTMQIAQDMAYTTNPMPIEAIDAFDTRSACISVINKMEREYKDKHYHRIDRQNETTLFMASAPIGQNREQISLTCRPDTVDPRGPKRK